MIIILPRVGRRASLTTPFRNDYQFAAILEFINFSFYFYLAIFVIKYHKTGTDKHGTQERRHHSSRQQRFTSWVCACVAIHLNLFIYIELFIKIVGVRTLLARFSLGKENWRRRKRFTAYGHIPH